jgi:hypothetical protein
MTSDQRYISKELTHFTGGDCIKPDRTPDEDAQYACLVKILRDGRLLHRRDCPDGPARFEFRGDKSFMQRTMIHVDAVYFCDIPVPDFAVHTVKYSPFGLSFLKSFLIRQGANPAFYVAGDSVIPPDHPGAKVLFPDPKRRPEPLTRAELMERLIKDHLVSDNRLLAEAFREKVDKGLTPRGTVFSAAAILDSMIRSDFLSFCVPFDSKKDDTDKENYYMEREWRVIGDVKFKLDDVCRVILPGRYAKRFREDVPEYFGQIAFPEIE